MLLSGWNPSLAEHCAGILPAGLQPALFSHVLLSVSALQFGILLCYAERCCSDMAYLSPGWHTDTATAAGGLGRACITDVPSAQRAAIPQMYGLRPMLFMCALLPRRFHTDPSGTYVQYEAKAIGSGSEGAQTALQESYR